ncbi:glycosyltransferase [Rhizobium sp. MHM7A]|uniref:glycosyltransferase n=1 Tax=Rhizobium sp. MHM7A TaxID=2583233 RepID=UPI0011062930|nr:glycosyltransferase [Rhizobium sp. MHM7A]TLX16802.1 glycosyltransferase [Rhizobium sp. MHM7A]
MRIAVVSKADATGGGASRVANDIVESLASRGIAVKHLAARSSQGWTDLRKPILGPKLPRILLSKLQSTAREFGLGEIIPFEVLSVLYAVRNYDLVHFHDTSSAFSPLTLFLVSKLKPVVWTFHDCSPFTGGCLYPQVVSCERYKTTCGKCPQLHEWPLASRLDTTGVALKLRRLLHKQGHVVTVAPSKWMQLEAIQSGNVSVEPTVISNMVNTTQFFDTDDRTGLRRRLGLNPEGLVIALSSGLLSDVRKGVDDGIACIKQLKHLNPTLVMIGNPDPTLHSRLEGVDYMPTGYLRDREMLRCWLAASDLFLFTSKADNQPLSIAEALACGTPVYGYPTGGAAEMIVDGQTGRFAQARAPEELAEIIGNDVGSGQLFEMRHAARRHAESNFGEETFVMEHVNLYQATIKNWNKA